MVPNPESNELTGWKEIAAYLDIDVRTAQRWEEERSLPVARSIGPKGRVLADRDALDRWKKEWAVAKPFWSRVGFLRSYSLAVTALLLLVAGALSRGLVENYLDREPSNVVFEGSNVIVTGSRGRELWRHKFSKPFNVTPRSPVQTLFRIADIDADGRSEVLVAEYPVGWIGTGMNLYCFSETGEVRWVYRPGKNVSDADRSYAGAYGIRFEVMSGNGEPGRPKIAITGTHSLAYPGFIAVLDSTGREVGRYCHSGHLAQMQIADLDGDGREEIIAGGTDNGRRSATLVVLDPENMHGVNAEPPGSRQQLSPFTPANEKAVVIFPRTCLGRDVEEHGSVSQISFNGETLDVVVDDSVISDANGYVVYSFDRKLNVTSIIPSDTMRSRHRQQERNGILHHTLETDIPALREVEYLKRY